MSFKADLHCHTTASDGSDTPENLIDLAIKAGLQGLSITDHDTISAYEGIRSPRPLLLSGLELSTVYGQESIHILAYGFPLSSALMHELCQEQAGSRHERNIEILAKIRAHGIKIEDHELQGIKGRPHIAVLLVDKGVVSSIKEAFDLYLGEGKLFYAPGKRMQVVEAIQRIREAKGKVVLAHPHLIKQKQTLKALLAMPFDGIEGYYAMMPKQKCAPFLKIAVQKGWIVTGGSDYHGSIKPQSTLGSSWTPEESFRLLYDHYLRVS